MECYCGTLKLENWQRKFIVAHERQTVFSKHIISLPLEFSLYPWWPEWPHDLLIRFLMTQYSTSKPETYFIKMNKRYFYGPTWLSWEHWTFNQKQFYIEKKYEFNDMFIKNVKFGLISLWNNIFSNPKIKPWPKYLICNFIDNKTVGLIIK